MDIQKFFFDHPIFRLEDFLCHKDHLDKKHASMLVKRQLHYYVTTKKILPVRRGLYAVIPPGTAPADLSPDPYLIAAHLTKDSILAYYTALELYGMAYSVLSRLTYISSYKTKPFFFRGYYFQPVTPPAMLRRAEKTDIGVTTIDRQGLKIKITSLARTIVDLLARPDLAGGLEEVFPSLARIAIFNIEEAIKYALTLKNATLCAKLGFYLSQRKDAFAITTKQLNILKNKIPQFPQYMDVNTKKRKDNHLIKEWNLIVSKNILDNAWEEPNNDFI